MPKLPRSFVRQQKRLLHDVSDILGVLLNSVGNGGHAVAGASTRTAKATSSFSVLAT